MRCSNLSIQNVNELFVESISSESDRQSDLRVHAVRVQRLPALLSDKPLRVL